MKKLTAVLIWVVCALLTYSYSVSAQTIIFGDSSYYWPGWSNGSEDDNKDTIGIPDLLGGTVVIEDGYLKSITFKYTGTQDWADNYWDILSPGDLFINCVSSPTDERWDYLVDLFVGTSLGNASYDRTPGPDNEDPSAGTYSVYKISEPLTGSNYIISGVDNSGSWAGYGIRDKHPVAYSGNTEWLSSVSFDGWKELTEPDEPLYSTFDFTNGGNQTGLFVGCDDLIIGWAMNCANDVIYEKIPNPVPEPGTILLVGTGLLGLALGSRKKRTK